MKSNKRNKRNTVFPISIVFFVTSMALILFYKGKLQEIIDSNNLLRSEIEVIENELEVVQNENTNLKNEIENLKNIKGGIQEHGALSVKDTHLVDQNGEVLVLRGIGSHGLAWYPEYTNYNALKTLKEYGANVFRISMYVEQNMGYLEEPVLNEKLMYLAIENSLAADMYTIVDWHVLRDENPKNNLIKAKEFFENIAKRYGEEPGIIYEICNEPNGDTSYEDIVKYADEIIPLIRKYAPEAVILVGTPKFCTSLDGPIENPLNYNNIMYTYHYYADISDCEHALEEITRGIDNDIPIFISEWGLDSYEATDEDWEATECFLEFLDEKNIGWINWSLSNKEEGYSIVEKDVLKLGQWEKNELTNMGRYIIEYIQRKDS